MRRACIAVLALALTACGGSTGVRDAGKPPVARGPERTVQLWVIKPGGRVGVERDLVPVGARVPAFDAELPAVVLQRLERGLDDALARAGYRTALGCCAATVVAAGGGVLRVSDIVLAWTIGPAPTMASWVALAGAAQVQRTLAALPGVRSVTVNGLSQRAVSEQLARGVDPDPARPVASGSCRQARRLGPVAAVATSHPARERDVVRVRAPMAVAVEFDALNWGQGETESEATIALLRATVVRCGIVDVPLTGTYETDGGTRLTVRVTPLAGPARAGIVRGLHALPGSNAP